MVIGAAGHAKVVWSVTWLGQRVDQLSQFASQIKLSRHAAVAV